MGVSPGSLVRCTREVRSNPDALVARQRVDWEGVVRIGLLADIHEDIEALEQALAILQAVGVSRLAVLGDLLSAAGAVGVCGNHDMGLCHEPDPGLLARYPVRVSEFVATLAPQLEVGGCLLSHGLPHWDATNPAAYYLGDPPESAAGRAASFAGSGCRVTFVGHFHRRVME